MTRLLTNAPLMLATALVVTVGTACTTVAAPLTVAHPLGGRQCEGGGSTAQALAARLRDAGLAVSAVTCGHDGRMRPAVCGGADGQLAVMEIDASQLPRARELGFKPLSDWPEARRRPCPAAAG